MRRKDFDNTYRWRWMEGHTGGIGHVMGRAKRRRVVGDDWTMYSCHAEKSKDNKAVVWRVGLEGLEEQISGANDYILIS
jgi:hypothetical protein